MDPNYINTYWCDRGKYQTIADALQKLVPRQGSVPDAKTKNAFLEKFRVASNAYYDLYNNGLGNRASEFREVFGFSGRGEFNQALVDRTETRMDEIIIAAGFEQGIIEVVLKGGK